MRNFKFSLVTCTFLYHSDSYLLVLINFEQIWRVLDESNIVAMKNLCCNSHNMRLSIDIVDLKVWNILYIFQVLLP